jgi:3-oxoacyl-[acyl-carrier protein] reductase
MLGGQSILVTGATGAIGQAICRCLAAEGRGW